MRAFGAELIEHGDDFDAASAQAERIAGARGLFRVPSFHPELVRGVASYALELFDAAGALDTVYVPIGMGSGLCGVIAARDALGLSTKVVGVVAAGAPANKLSFEAGHVVATQRAATFADGCAVRIPHPEAVAMFAKGADRMIAVEEDAIAEAVRILWQDTHNLAEGAGAVALAGLLQERDAMQGRRVAVILSGGNVDTPVVTEILAGRTPRV